MYKCHKNERKTIKGKTQKQMHRLNYKVYRNERVELGKKYRKTGDGRIETAGDFSVIINPYIWKRLMMMMTPQKGETTSHGRPRMRRAVAIVQSTIYKTC